MAEEKLELKLIDSFSRDILKIVSADKHEKIGEIGINTYTVAGIEGRVILKEVYTNDGEFKGRYFSDSDFVNVEERKEIQSLLQIPSDQLIFVGF